MTFRERLLAAIAGRPTDQIPWAPRMDLWSIALRSRGTLPPRFQGKNTVQIAQELGMACHAVRADYTLKRDPRELMLRGLGFDNHPDYPYRVELRGLPVEFRHDQENLWTTVRTPAGPVHLHLQLTAQMARDGISLPFVQSYPIRTEGDLEAVAQLFDHLEVVPTPGAYAAFRERVGEQGVAVATGMIAASPVHLILHELMPMEQFFYFYHDNRPAVEQLAARMTPFFNAALDAVAASGAEVIYWGANYDQDLTWPGFFAAEIVPWLQRVGQRLHAKGKYLLTHTDGENQKLLPLYPACGFDVAESVCPAPMTRSTLAELRAGLGPQTTVWGGIPSVALLEESMDERHFEAYLDRMFAELGAGDRLILGVSDNVPPDCSLARLERIRERVEAFGPVRSRAKESSVADHANTRS